MINMYRDYLWDKQMGLEFSKIPVSLVGWDKTEPTEKNILTQVAGLPLGPWANSHFNPQHTSVAQTRGLGSK